MEVPIPCDSEGRAMILPPKGPRRGAAPPVPLPPAADPAAAAADLARGVADRLPLAEASLLLLRQALDDERLRAVFDRHRGRCYERLISFPTLVRLLTDALLQHAANGRQGFARAREGGTLPASPSAAYGKLARVPLPPSQGLLLDSTASLRALFPGEAATALPASLAGMELVAVDGKKIKHVARRLKATRGQLGQLFGGKLVVALSVNTRLAVALAADPGGEAGDTPLMPEVVRQVRGRGGPTRLWIGDRLFCDLGQPELLTRDGDHFLLRYNKRMGFHPDARRPAKEGADGQGRRWAQEWGWVGRAEDARRRYVRRVTLYRPGEEDVGVISDLLDEGVYPAGDLLAAYLLRWEIENCFQQITEVFELRRLIGSSPEATVFQAALCLVLYNVVVVARGHVAAAERMAAEGVSSEQLFHDVRRQLIAWTEVLTAEQTVGLVRPLTAEQARRRLGELLGGAWTERWRKDARPRRPGVPAAKRYPKGGHTSVYRLLHPTRAAPDRPGPPPSHSS
jgi:hypothetical protein